MRKEEIKARCTISIDTDIVERIDNLVKNKVFASRSHAAERALHKMLQMLNEGEWQ